MVFNVPAFIDSRRIGGLQVLIVILCGLVVLFDGLNTQVIGYLGPALAKDWQLPRSALGPIFSGSLVGLMLGLMLIAPLADRFGRKRTMITSTVLFGCFTLLTAAAHGLPDLFFYRLVAGIGLGGALPNALALTSEYCPARRRATLVVIMFCGFSLGSILGGGLTAALISRFGWRPVFLVGGALPLLLVPALILLLPESLLFLVTKGESATKIEALLRRIDSRFTAPAGVRFATNENTPGGVPLAQLFSGRRGMGTLLLWTVFFCNLMVFFFLQNWLPTIFTDAGFKAETAILISTLVSVGGIACGLLSGSLMDRFGPYPVLATLYLGGTFFVILLGFASTSLASIAAATLGAGFCVSGGQKSVNALAVIFYPTTMRSTGVGWALGVGRIGSILGPLLGGWLMARGWSTAGLFNLAALPMFGAAAVMVAMGVRYPIPRAENMTNEEREALA